MNIEWPRGKRFAICLTHDVDRVKKTWWQSLYYFVKTRKLYHLKTMFQKRNNPYWNFERIMAIEDKYGVRSTFFFLNENKKLEILRPSTYKLSLGRYDINSPEIVEIIKELDKNGWEIGVHGSYDSYRNKELLTKEKKTLEKIVGHKVIGIRQHYLNLELPTTWKLQKAVGFKYDASFGYRRDVGFRDGKLLPFKPFGDDDFLVIPTTIMDSALFYKYPNLKDAWRKVLNILDRAEKNGALVTVLWHQRVFNEKEFPGWSKIYEKIIAEGMRRRAWFATCGEIYEACLK